MNSNGEAEKLLTVGEAAALLQVKPGTLYSWVSKGKVPFRKVGSLVRFDRGELLRWTAEQAQQSEPAAGKRANLRVV